MCNVYTEACFGLNKKKKKFTNKVKNACAIASLIKKDSPWRG